MNSFYNTTNETGDTLVLLNSKAKKRDELILEFFIKNKGILLRPEDVHRALFGFKDIPITSTRRSITNLTDAGHLIKTDTKRKGNYNSNVHCWVYLEKKESNGQITLF